MFDTREETSAHGDPLARIRSGIAVLSEEDRDGWSGTALSGRLVELVEVRERIDAEMARVTARWHDLRGWEADGALSPVAWLTHRAPMSASDARHLVRTAKVVQSAPELAEALEDGRTTAAHLGALARVVSPRRRPVLAEHDAVLAKQAERLSVAEFTLLARRWAALADDHLAADSDAPVGLRSEVRAAVTMDGWVDGTFRLDPVAGSRLLATLDHLAPPDPADAPDGVRSLPERRGDALGDLAAWYHQGGRAGGNPPSLDVIVDVATLAGGDVDLARARCDLDGVGPITRATLERLGCGATLTRLVMAGDSVILDMGRRTRFATPAQARSVRVHDGGCIFPSCDRPPQWCDIHHIQGWARGGRTDVSCLVCLCTRHHTLVHNSAWTITAEPGGTFTVSHPARGP